MKITKNIPLLVGIALPIVFILVISMIVFIPSLSIKPQYNFLYLKSNSPYYYNYNQELIGYALENNHLSLKPLPKTPDVAYKGDGNGDITRPLLYLYDVKNNTAHQVEFDEAKNFVLDPGPSSPDGYTVSYQYGNSGIFELFGSGGNQSGYVISKGNASKKLSGLNYSGYGYYNSGDFHFIGWVK
jgi:hypothetical protein